MRIAFISKDSSIPNYFAMSTADLFHACGENTGNLLFIDAIKNHLVGHKVFFDWDFDASILNDQFDAAILVCANIIRAGYAELAILENGISRLRIPFTAISLGIQAGLNESRPQITSTTRRVLSVIGDRCNVFGVRGETTAEFLTSIGVANHVIVGCPSNFINLDKRLGLTLEKHSHIIRDIAFQYDLFGVVEMAPNFYTLGNHIREIADGAKIKYFVQSPLALLEISRLTRDDYCPDEFKSLARDLFGYQDSDDLVSFARESIRSFFDVPSWLAEMRKFDFSIGPRLHGNVAAIQSGVPSVVVSHDARTQELARTLGLPHLTAKEVENFPNMEDFYGFSAPFYKRYDNNRWIYARNYVDVLQKSGLEVSPLLLAFTGNQSYGPGVHSLDKD